MTDQLNERPYLLERVDEAAVVQVYADDFERLPLNEKRLIWHLYQAALAGRDIYYDQRYAHNLEMRATLEAIVRHPEEIAPDVLAEIVRYTKLFWINTGPYNFLTARKFVLRLDPAVFSAAAHAAARRGGHFPVRQDETLDGLLQRLRPMFFDPEFEPMVTNKTPGAGRDMLAESANNLYRGVVMSDLERFDEQHELNSRLVKQNGLLAEEVYRIGGKYDAYLKKVVEHLEAARPYCTQEMSAALDALIRFYRSGSEEDRRAYDIAWVADQASPVDTINGFIEVYLDVRGCKGAWEALVFYVNAQKTRLIQTIAQHAQWFEDHMPWEAKYRRTTVTGVTARAIDVVIESGEAAPLTPIGINLPNDQVIREQYGSKSVSLSNVLEAYDKSQPASFKREFCWSPEELARAERWGSFASETATNLHEVVGHGSGVVAERLRGNPQAALQEHYSAIEETRADLVALYFIADPKMVELALIDAEHHDDVVRAEYEGFTRTALVQLRRLREGETIEEDHMRNRQAIVHWLMANTSAIERRSRDGKTYYVMVDPVAFREGVGRLVSEIQRIKSEGDYAAAKALFETHGIHFDAKLRDEIVERVDSLNLPSYQGFVMPKLTAVRGPDGTITDVQISYPMDLTKQMLEFAGGAESLAVSGSK
jgi:dipeptidyl-peptidase III